MHADPDPQNFMNADPDPDRYIDNKPSFKTREKKINFQIPYPNPYLGHNDLHVVELQGESVVHFVVQQLHNSIQSTYCNSYDSVIV